MSLLFLGVPSDVVTVECAVDVPLDAYDLSFETSLSTISFGEAMYETVTSTLRASVIGRWLVTTYSAVFVSTV